MRTTRVAIWTAVLPALFSLRLAWAFAGGTLSGVIKDPTGALVPRAKLTLVHTALKAQYQTTADSRGFHSFPSLPVGHYDLTIEAT